MRFSRALPIPVVLAILLFQLPLQADFSPENWLERVRAETDIDRLGRLYVELLMEENPSQSDSMGLHGKGDEPWYYDRRLPDPSAEAEARWRLVRDGFLQRLTAIDPDSLDRPDQIDLHILTQRVRMDQFQVERLKELDNPLNWVTSLGQAMSGLVLRDYAPLDARLQSFGARCAATDEFLEKLRARLAPAVIRPTAAEKTVSLHRLAGLTAEGALYDKTLPDRLAQSGLDENRREAIARSCGEAEKSVQSFAAWFEQTVVPRQDSEWRLGPELYDAKYALQMDYPLNPTSLLAVADGWLAVKGAELVSVGRQIHDQYLAEEIAAGTVQPHGALDDQQVVRNIFAKLAEDRSTPETLIADSYAMADSIIGFVREQDLMDLPPASKLRIEPIPPHLAGNAVAQIQTAPPFEPGLESVWFWDIEFLSAAPDFLKEYNRPTLAMVYIHEGVPGHFVQLEYSNRSERVIPRVFWNGPMVEGWASYIATQLVEVGYTVYPDHPLGHQLQQMVDDKLILRAIINAIIDIRLHRTQWPEAEAVALMVQKGFQEESEAQGKLVRARLSSVQLATYFAGHIAIEDILAEYRAVRGAAFSWKDFNQRLVGAGSPPFFAIREYMLADPGAGQ